MPFSADAPRDDAIASAARSALGELARPGIAHAFSWAVVETRARRVQRRRLAAIGAAIAIVLLGGGTAVAGVNRDRGGHVNIAEGVPPTSEPTTTTPESYDSSSAATTTTIGGPIAVPGTDASPTTTTVPTAQATDFVGTLTLASTTLIAEQPTSVTLTMRNISGHSVSLPAHPYLGVYIDFLDNEGFGVPAADSTFATGEERSFTTTITPRAELIGSAQLSAAFVWGVVMDVGGDPDPILPGVPSVAITIVPPGTRPGQPLDPSVGTWKAVMSADAAEARVGNAVTVHALLTNVGRHAQATQGYGSLAIVCNAASDLRFGQFIGVATMQPGAKQTFSVDFELDERLVGKITCSVGLAFHGNENQAEPREGIDSNTVTITVLPASEPTTDPTTTTTSSP